MQPVLPRRFASHLSGCLTVLTALGVGGCDPDSPNGPDSNRPSTGREACDPGFELQKGTCQDIDECATGPGVCDSNATCLNQPGTFVCQCREGFVGDGRACTPAANRCDDFPRILAAPENRCTTCHSTTPGIGGGNLDLTSNGVGPRLLNRPSGNTRCRNELLINSQSPEDSLILKLVDPVRHAAWGEDACMGMMPFGGNGVSATDVSCFEQWVQDVADNHPAPPPPPVVPFDPMPPASVLSKVKLILHGGAPTDAELAQVTAADGSLDHGGLRQTIMAWRSSPAFERKIRSFLQLSLQQIEINPSNRPYDDQLDRIAGNDVVIDRSALFANLEESFVRTAWRIVSSGGDFREVVTTRRWQVTTAMLTALVYADRRNNPGPNFERFAHLTPDDYADWRDVNLTQAADAGQVPQFANTAEFATQIRSIPDGGALLLRAPRVGFFNTPTFFESWETNEDNQFRVTTNQTVLAALDILFEAGDTTEQTNLNGLAAEHALPDTACYQCHRLLDPMRLPFANVYTFRYRVRDDVETELEPSFAFQGYNATPRTMDEFGVALTNHPRFPIAWVQKLCMWGNSQRCDENDSEFQRIVGTFAVNYNFMDLLLDIFTSPLITGSEITDTHDTAEFFVSIARSNHLCSAVETRLAEARANRCASERAALNQGDPEPPVCTPRPNSGSLCNANRTTRDMAGLISSDAYGRGAREFIQESLSGPFNARALEEMCTAVARREVGGGNPPRTFSASDVTGALDRMVKYVMGLPESHERYGTARAGIQKTYDVARATPICSEAGLDVVDSNADEVTCGFGLNTNRSLFVAWIFACSSPELAGQGL